jgi:hypothetical protein
MHQGLSLVEAAGLDNRMPPDGVERPQTVSGSPISPTTLQTTGRATSAAPCDFARVRPRVSSLQLRRAPVALTTGAMRCISDLT